MIGKKIIEAELGIPGRQTTDDIRFRALIENSFEGITLLDKDLNIFYRSQSAERISGWQSADRAKMSMEELIHPQDEDRVKLILQDIVRHPGKSTSCIFRSKHFDGHYIWIECFYTNLLHKQDTKAIVCNFRDISEKKYAEELQQQTIKELFAYKYALDESAIIGITDQKGIIKHVNENFCRISKYSEAELIGQDHRIINSSYHGKDFISNLWKTIATGKIWKGELKNKAKDGTHYWVDTTIVPFLNEHGKPYQYVAIRSDITEKKHSQEQLQKTLKESYTRSLIEASLDPLVTISPEGKITDVNEASVKATGVVAEKLIGTDFSDYFTEPEKAKEGYKQVFEKGLVSDYPLTIRHRDGTLTDVLYNASVYKDEQGNVLGVFAAARDITQQKRTSQYARSLIEASLDPLVTISPEGKITDVNEASVNITGVAREKLIGTDFSDYFTEPQKAKEGYQQVFQKGLVADYPLTIRHSSGTLTDVLYNASVYKDEQGNVLGVFAAARDITQQKRTSQYARSLIEASLDPLVTISPEGKITDVNEASVKATGIPTEKLIGTDFSDYFTEPEKAKEGYKQVFEKGLVADYPLTIRHVDGKLTDVLYNASVYKDEQGNVLGVFAAARDITQQKRTSQYARSLIEASLDPLVTISPEGKITDVNEASVKATGVPSEKLIGTDFSDYFTEPEKAKEGYKQVFEKGLVADYPLTIRHIDGNLTDVLYNASVYKDDQGNVLGVFAAARDITQQKRTSQYARSLIEASLDPLVTISPEGKITDVNEASVKITGVPADKLVGTDFSDYFTEPEKAKEGYKQVFEKGLVADYPLTIRHIDGNLTDVLYNASVYKDDQGKVLGVFAAARDITQQKRTSQYARSLIEASLDPLVTISPEGKITDVNEASVKITGVPADNLVGTDFSDYFTEPEKAREGYKQVFEKGFVSDYPLTIRHVNKSLTAVLYNASVYKDDKGNVLGVFAAARDITKQKEAEDKIKKIQSYTRTLIESSLDPQITKGSDGLITDVNEATILVTGVSRENLIGTHFPNYFTEPERAEEAYQEAFAKGVVRNRLLAIKHISGKTTDVLYNATVYKDENGIVQGVFASARDITDRKQAEEELKRSQEYTRSLIEASLDPLVTISPEGKITDVNEASIQATGVAKEGLIGTDFSDYFTDPEKAREGYQQVFARGFVADYPLTIRHKDGKVTDVLYNASVYRDDKGEVLGVFAAARDITAQRRQEIKINTLNEELEQRIIELESFSYSVSHDLRAPLRGVDGFVAMFLSKYLNQVDEEGQRLLNNVRRNVTKMGSLIDELLTLSRIGMKDIQITTIDMTDLVVTVLEELDETKGNANVIVKDLGFAKGDIALIKQVLVNLISNAYKYSNKTEHPVIEIGCKVNGQSVVFSVKDNGVGFDMEYSNKLFGVFQRLHDPHEYQGTGVGLAIVKRIITRHGGKVWAEGVENVGATFYFSLKKY
jgi:PAS domain S-box-containing protein